MSTELADLFNEIRTLLPRHLPETVTSTVQHREGNSCRVGIVTPLGAYSDEKQYIVTIDGDHATISRIGMFNRPYHTNNDNRVNANASDIVEKFVNLISAQIKAS